MYKICIFSFIEGKKNTEKKTYVQLVSELECKTDYSHYFFTSEGYVMSIAIRNYCTFLCARCAVRNEIF